MKLDLRRSYTDINHYCDEYLKPKIKHEEFIRLPYDIFNSFFTHPQCVNSSYVSECGEVLNDNIIYRGIKFVRGEKDNYKYLYPLIEGEVGGLVYINYLDIII